MTLPRRHPRLMGQRREAEMRALRVAEEQQAREVWAKRTTEAVQADRVRRRKTATPLARALESAGGWTLSVLGALVVSLALTWFLRHPETLRVLVDALRHCGR